MNKLFLIIILVAFLVIILAALTACSREASKVYNQALFQERVDGALIIQLDGCQYYVIDQAYGAAFFHKGNCTNPIHCYNTPK